MKALSYTPPYSVYCCDRCSALVDDTTQTPHRVITCPTVLGCQVCMILLRQARQSAGFQDDEDINVIRRGTALEESATGTRLLRLCCDIGLSSNLCL
jgi:hypothetical protein